MGYDPLPPAARMACKTVTANVHHRIPAFHTPSGALRHLAQRRLGKGRGGLRSSLRHGGEPHPFDDALALREIDVVVALRGGAERLIVNLG
jgi:hypothetical protein